MRLVAQITSWVFMPLFIPIYCLILTFFTISFEDFVINQNSLWSLPNPMKWAVLNLYAIFTVIAPGVSILILRNRKMISSIELTDRTQRFFPILLMVFYTAALYLLFVLKAGDALIPTFIYSLPLSGTLVSLTLFLVNFKFKVSLHAAGGGILFGYILAYCMKQQYFEFWVLLLAAISTGLTISARLYLNKHTMDEVVHGWLIAFLITFSVNYLYQ
jgi:membrane-associated phospholipid phosphatase